MAGLGSRVNETNTVGDGIEKMTRVTASTTPAATTLEVDRLLDSAAVNDLSCALSRAIRDGCKRIDDDLSRIVAVDMSALRTLRDDVADRVVAVTYAALSVPVRVRVQSLPSPRSPNP